MDDERDRTQPPSAAAHHYTYTYVDEGRISAGIPIPFWTTCADAPLSLPDGALISAIGMFARDNDDTDDFRVELLRKPVGAIGTPPELLADLSTAGASPGVQAPYEAFAHQFDRAFVYSLRSCMGIGSLYHVWIEYGEGSRRNPITLHPAAFRETTGRAEAVHLVNEGFVHSIWGEIEYLAAPLDLPAGATIRSFGATLSNPGDRPFSIQLRRKRLNNTVVSELIGEVASIPFDGSAQTPQDADVTEPLVDPAYHYYLVAVDLDGTNGQQIYDVTIEHDDPLFADGFESGDISRWSGVDAPTTGSMVLTAAAFRAHQSALSTENPPALDKRLTRFDWFKGMLHIYPIDIHEGPPCAIAPIDVPEGSRLTAWTLWGYDQHTSDDMTVELHRKFPVLGTSDVIGSITSISSLGHFVRFQALDHRVDNLAQQLYVAWCQPDGPEWSDFGLIGIELFWER
jgi:hypothetical protein